MTTYGCAKEEQAQLAHQLRRIAVVTGSPIRVGCHRGGGVFVEFTVPGRGKQAQRLRSKAHWALMDAEAVLGVRSRGVFASTCTTCGGTGAEYDHTPAFCAAMVQLSRSSAEASDRIRRPSLPVWWPTVVARYGFQRGVNLGGHLHRGSTYHESRLFFVHRPDAEDGVFQIGGQSRHIEFVGEMREQ
jgi:hypothetical protein